MSTPSGASQPNTYSAPANPTAGALLVATAPTPATADAEALLWRPMRGRPLAGWALAALAEGPGLEKLGHGATGLERPAVAAVVIVARAERRDEAEAMIADLPAPVVSARVVASEPDWRASLAAGLAALPADCAWVIVLDAARPLVTPAMLAAGYEAALVGEGVALAGELVYDTLKRVVAGRVVETPPRAALRRLTPPLVIHRDQLARALQPSAAPDGAGLAAIALASGARVAAYPFGSPNSAVTSAADWSIAEALLDKRGAGG